MTNPETALLSATAVHLGFQLTVTVLVYPALGRVPAEQWEVAHGAHSGAITPLVGAVYGSLALTGCWALLSDPDRWTLVALAAIAATVLITALGAAPTHGRLGAGYDREQVVRLLRVDRIRAVSAVVAFVASVLAVS